MKQATSTLLVIAFCSAGLFAACASGNSDAGGVGGFGGSASTGIPTTGPDVGHDLGESVEHEQLRRPWVDLDLELGRGGLCGEV